MSPLLFQLPRQMNRRCFHTGSHVSKVASCLPSSLVTRSSRHRCLLHLLFSTIAILNQPSQATQFPCTETPSGSSSRDSKSDLFQPHFRRMTNVCSKYCGGDRDEPFSIMLLGQKYHVIPSMSLISSVYKNHPILTTHGIIQDVYQQVGVSEEGLKIIYKGSTPEKVLHISLGSLIQQFSPGQLLDDISVKMLGYAEQKLQWAEIPDLGSPQSRSNSAGKYSKLTSRHIFPIFVAFFENTIDS